MKLHHLPYSKRTELLRYMRKCGEDIPGTLSAKEINTKMQKYLDENVGILDVIEKK